MNDLVALSIRQFVEAWRLLCAPSPSHAVAAEDGIAYRFIDLPVAFFNAAFVTPRHVATGDRLGSAEGRSVDVRRDAGVRGQVFTDGCRSGKDARVKT